MVSNQDIWKVFDKETVTWDVIKAYLIDGYLAFEIIYKDDEAIASKQLDPCTLIASVQNNGNKIWIQYPDNEKYKRVLSDSQVIMISYSDVNMHQSYVESLIRSYENFRIVENAYVANVIKVPGIYNKVEKHQIDYFRKKFIESTRIPEEYFKKIDSSFGCFSSLNIIDKRYERFIHRHALNLYKILKKISNLDIEIKLKSIYI